MTRWHVQVPIHGGLSREDRRTAKEAFTSSSQRPVLPATDAASEGKGLAIQCCSRHARDIQKRGAWFGYDNGDFELQFAADAATCENVPQLGHLLEVGLR